MKKMILFILVFAMMSSVGVYAEGELENKTQVVQDEVDLEKVQVNKEREEAINPTEGGYVGEGVEVPEGKVGITSVSEGTEVLGNEKMDEEDLGISSVGASSSSNGMNYVWIGVFFAIISLLLFGYYKKN